MLSTYIVSPNGCDDEAVIRLVDLPAGKPPALPASLIKVSTTVVRNTVNVVEYLTALPVVATLEPGTTDGDQIIFVLKEIGSEFSIKDGATTIVYQKSPPLNSDTVLTFRWTGTNWISIL